MPWYLQLLLPMIINLVQKYGLPVVEQKFPWLVPIIEEILKIIGGNVLVPSKHLKLAADHYNASKSQNV